MVLPSLTIAREDDLGTVVLLGREALADEHRPGRDGQAVTDVDIVRELRCGRSQCRAGHNGIGQNGRDPGADVDDERARLLGRCRRR